MKNQRASLARDCLRRVTFGLLLWALAGAVPAQSAQRVAHKDDSTLHFKQNLACAIWPHCALPASPVFPNPIDHGTLVTLELPPGDYLVNAKLSAFANNGTNYMNVECALVDSASPTPLEYSSFDGTAQQTLFLQTAVSIRARHGGGVRVGCRAFGFQPDGTSLVDVRVWNVQLTALSVGSIRRSYQ